MFNVSWLSTLLIGLFLSQIIILLVTVYFHRACSHNAVKLSKGSNKVCRFLAWFLISMDPREFASVHRKHHAKCDKEDDPHSPVNHGWYGVLFGGLILYQREAKNEETIKKYGSGLPKDSWENFYHKQEYLGIFLFALSLILLFGIKGFVLWGILMAWIPFWAAGVVNGLGHHMGYRNFQTDDNSTNLFPWGIWIGGEELHNNHHAFPASAKFSRKKWEVDLGWVVIKCAEKLNLLTIREKPKSHMEFNKEIGKINSLIRYKHFWLSEFQKSVSHRISPLVKRYGFKNWHSFSKFYDKLKLKGYFDINSKDNFELLRKEITESGIKKNKYKKKMLYMIKMFEEHPKLFKLFILENELRYFSSIRNYLTKNKLMVWCENAFDFEWSELSIFAKRLSAI